ncbi:hypothetical protein ASPWEDRAFT_144490 [Aspergillus wentii DTO 134E9]|uniref:Zn(2)-C6 fungal-type domain-containing protein n=1 Tax=Aspergillus wentii DTO 134E9 TaxID=1073089 RepID=A0A1L9RYP0_ASPWE|nr:uncharacterized protein ASPWEDRAFT_144490 [Aspergillus wentii DTO 134E9]KAI9932520.1 hypothetical protein MW887_008762 [Aspergillus wentii]OJJ40086.1 hypothetical protein ASPWEDRAFT_144490 [Aspergillus wentii DTO 134E9]
MPGVPSNKACERCKKRHMKCDETRPKCERCTAAGVECPGYVQTRKFIDQGATVRRRYAPYPENHPSSVNDADKTRSSPCSGENAQMASVAEGTHERNAFAMPSPLQGMTSNSRPNPTQMGAANIQNSTNQAPYDINPLTFDREQSSSSRSNAQNSVSPNNDPFNVLNAPYPGLGQRPRDSRVSSSEEPSQRSEKEEFQDIFSELMTGTEHEIAFLIRHFSEVLGPWLDLSDSRKFFTVYVPIHAINSDFLKHSIAALVAKHLGRVKGAKCTTAGGMSTNPATMELYPNSSDVDWFLKAANYYYLAVSRLNASISDYYSTVSSSVILESPIETVGRWLRLQAAQAGSVSFDRFSRKAEDLLAASALLTMYKLMDEPGENWQSHLTGIKPLFNSLLQIHTNQSSTYPLFSHGASAVFWNFARQDYLASYFNRLPTHLDQENLPLWRAAGISIDTVGNTSFHNDPQNSRITSQEDLVANSLIWIMNKTVNFLADFRKSQLAHWTVIDPSEVPTSPGTAQHSHPDTSTWLRLCIAFQGWFDHLPEAFRPCLRLDHPKDTSKPPEIIHLPFPEIFYSLTTCTAAMQQYHFGRLALLLNRPPDVVSAPSTAFDRLQGYREVTKEVDYRCREISGIALGRPQGGVRIYMVPVLLAVGQCLEKPEERQIVVDLLRGVEADLGWSTDGTIQRLQSYWDQSPGSLAAT